MSLKPLAVGLFILLARWLCGRGLHAFLLAPLLLCAFALCSLAQTNDAITNSGPFIPLPPIGNLQGGNAQAPAIVLDAENPLAPLAALLGSSLAKKILLWMGCIGAVTKLFAARLQQFLETAVVAARANPDSRLSRWLDAVLSHPVWHVFVFGIDYFTRIKIPRSLACLPLCALCVLCGCQSPVPGTHFSGSIGGVPFKFDGHKQTEAHDVTLTVVSCTVVATNYSTLHIGSLKSLNDPQVISKSYAGQAAVMKTMFDGLNQTLSKMVEGGAKGLTAKASPDANFWSPDGLSKSNIWITDVKGAQ